MNKEVIYFGETGVDITLEYKPAEIFKVLIASWEDGGTPERHGLGMREGIHSETCLKKYDCVPNVAIKSQGPYVEGNQFLSGQLVDNRGPSHFLVPPWHCIDLHLFESLKLSESLLLKSLLREDYTDGNTFKYFFGLFRKHSL